MYSRCLRIWFIARISFLSDANITYKIFINLQYSKKNLKLYFFVWYIAYSKLKNILGLNCIDYIWKVMMAIFLIFT